MCTDHSVESCLSDIDPTFTIDVLADEVPIIDLAYLDAHCDDMVYATACLESFAGRCDVVDEGFLLGIGDAYEWLCGDGRQEYINYQPCFAENVEEISCRISEDGDACGYEGCM